EVSSLVIDPKTPSVIYAGVVYTRPDGSGFTLDGVFRSSDGGSTWAPADHGLPIDIYTNVSLVINPVTPTTLYAAIGGSETSGVYETTDGGASWTAVNNGLPFNIPVGALAIDPSTPTTLYALTAHGMFKSTDGGGNWVAANNGLTSLSVSALAM